jgi:YceI-like domain
VSPSPPLLLHRRSPTEIKPRRNQLSVVKTFQEEDAMKSFAVLAVAVLLAQAAFAQHQTFAVNSDASEVKIKLNTTHEVVNGTFHVQSGSINFDRTASHISGIVIVAAGSGKTGNDSRDKKMNREILKVDQFATVSFAPKAYTGTVAASGDSTIQVSGVFTLLGTPHDLTIPMQIQIDGSKATARAQFVVPYVQWGLKNPSFMFWKAENDVAIDLNVVGQVSD